MATPTVTSDVGGTTEPIDPAEILPPELPDVPITFETNKDYVRSIIEALLDLRTDGMDYVFLQDLPKDHRYFAYLDRVNAGGVPTEQVIDLNREAQGLEFRDQTEGEHPTPELQRH